jgi:plasmid stabilization system protein ParE
MRITLSKRATKSFLSIKNYIEGKWGGLVASAFEQKVIDFLDLLELFPEMGVIEVREKNIYGFQLTRQTRIFYRIKKETIIVLVFFDTRQHPKKRPK